MKKKSYKKAAFSLTELSVVILVISIIIAGVAQSDRLMRAAHVRIAQHLTESSPIFNINGLMFWLETSMDESFKDDEMEDGIKITKWNDINPQKAVKNNAIAGSGAITDTDKFYYNPASGASATNTSGPTYVQDGINSIPTLNFASDGHSSFQYVVVNPNATNVENAGVTTFMVLSYISNGGRFLDRACLSNGGAISCNGNTEPLLSSHIDSGTQKLFFNYRDNNNNLITYETDYNIIPNTPYIITFQRIYGKTFKVYINGTAYPNDSGMPDTVGATKLPAVKIGYHSDEIVDVINMNISEIAMFTGKVSAEDRKAVEKYLGKKYAIKVSD